MKNSLMLVVGLSLLILSSSPSYASNQCCIDGGCFYAANLPTGGTGPLPTLCGHTIYGTNCVITMQQNESVSSGSCVTIGNDTILNMNSKTITCSGTSCGTALILNDQASGGPTIINGPGSLLGCWHVGASVANTAMVPTLADVTVDVHNGSFACTGSGGEYGLGDVGSGVDGRFKTITRASVGFASVVGIKAGPTTSIVDSIVHDCGTGVEVGVSSPSVGTSISGSLIADNGTSIHSYTSTDPVGGPSTLKDSTVRNATVHFRNYGGANPPNAPAPNTQVIEFQGTTFVDNVIFH